MLRKTCIVKETPTGYAAFDEGGRRFCSRIIWQHLVRELKHWGYEIVPSNSRAGRTILDKLEGQVI